MNQIKTWQQRQVETGIRSVEAKDDEIRELRQAIEQAGKAEPYGWMVKGVPYVMRGSLAEELQKREAKHIGGDCVAFPVYLHPPTAPAQPPTIPEDEKVIAARYIARMTEQAHGITGEAK